MEFRDMMEDKLTLIQDGKIFKENIQGSVQENIIYTMDIKVPFKENDIILRELPNQLQESYIIDNPEFFNGGNLSHFKIKVHKSNQKPDTKAHIIQTITNNISGGENYININSPGSYFIKNTDLFNQINAKIKSEIHNTNDRDLLLNVINKLSKSETKDQYKTNFDELLQKGAIYMTIIAPFIPQLSSLLSG